MKTHLSFSFLLLVALAAVGCSTPKNSAGKTYFLDVHELGAGNVTAEAVDPALQNAVKRRGRAAHPFEALELVGGRRGRRLGPYVTRGEHGGELARVGFAELLRLLELLPELGDFTLIARAVRLQVDGLSAAFQLDTPAVPERHAAQPATLELAGR